MPIVNETCCYCGKRFNRLVSGSSIRGNDLVWRFICSYKCEKENGPVIKAIKKVSYIGAYR